VNADHRAIEVGSRFDDEQAENWLPQCGTTAEALRTKAGELVTRHWGLVELIASELLRYGSSEYDEIGLLYDIYRGEVTWADLVAFRQLMGKHTGQETQEP
jgi:hypothetical protein